MIWWIKTRRIHPILTCGILVFAVTTMLLQDSAVMLPAISISIGAPTALAFFTPVVIVGTLAQTLDNRFTSAEDSGIRPTRWMDTLLIVATVATVVVIALVGGWITGSSAVLQAGRNTCFLVGLMLGARAFIQRSGIILPLAWIFIVVFAGRRTGSDYHGWAITALPASAPHAVATAAVVLGFGIFLNHHKRSRM